MKNANCFDRINWYAAIGASNNLADGQCGLSDESVSGDWHLPNVRELLSLADYGNFNPALPTGHPFSNVQSSYYWSSTTGAGDNTGYAWLVNMYHGYMRYGYKGTNGDYVWPVRGGND